jgi:branched-chain amino acid transport system substrate-binding protein
VLAKYIHSHSFKTVVGELSFGKDGEWSKPRMVLTQFQNIAPSNTDQFKAGDHQPILWPPEFKTGEMIYPYADARKK